MSLALIVKILMFLRSQNRLWESLTLNSPIESMAATSSWSSSHVLPLNLFLPNTIDVGWICTTCQKVPLSAWTPSCCGAVYCESCQPPLGGKCQCDTPAESSILSPFINQKISGATVKCPYHRIGCPTTTTVGSKGIRLQQHLDQCGWAPIRCPGCDAEIQRQQMNSHRGAFVASTKAHCPDAPIKCDICDMKVIGSNWAAHEASSEHSKLLVSRLPTMFALVQQLQEQVTAQQEELGKAKKLMAEMKQEVSRCADLKQMLIQFSVYIDNGIGSENPSEGFTISTQVSRNVTRSRILLLRI